MLRSSGRDPRGSSPHAWGFQFKDGRAGRQRRFIPTRVGNPSPGLSLTVGTPVHPHTRGESAITVDQAHYFAGSSPHAWGTLRPAPAWRPPCRFIPTRVGNPFCCSALLSRLTVHPHTRGESGKTPDDLAMQNGSSPHAWGIPHVGRHVLEHRRFIPTRVGIPTHAPDRFRALPVHPHTRGDSGHALASRRAPAGSSPHAWGTRIILTVPR